MKSRGLSSSQFFFFSVDIEGREQLSICLRYVLDSCVKEVFVDFVPVERITGKMLADVITHHLTAWGLSLADLQGQCYDGGS